MTREEHKKIETEIERALKTTPDIDTRRALEKTLYQADAQLKEQAA